VALVFLLVKDSSQLWLYTSILASTTVLSQLFLWTRIKKEIVKVSVTIKDILKHLRPCLVLFIPVLSYSIYRVMDKTMIGMIAREAELGNYESAEKIISIPVSFITALGTVMLPHMSKKEKSDIEKSIYSTFELTMFFNVASIAGLVVIAPEFSKLFFGDGFDKTALIIQMISCTILFTGVASVIRTSYLIPLKKNKIYIKSTIIGAVLNLICNAIFIPLFGAYGACIGTILAEFTLMLYQIMKTRNNIDYMRVTKLFIRYSITGVIMAMAMMAVPLFIKGQLAVLLSQAAVGVVVYGILNRKFLLYDFLGKKRKEK
jgi:O-antigen/teichoic acid export membrane protein